MTSCILIRLTQRSRVRGNPPHLPSLEKGWETDYMASLAMSAFSLMISNLAAQSWPMCWRRSIRRTLRARNTHPHFRKPFAELMHLRTHGS